MYLKHKTCLIYEDVYTFVYRFTYHTYSCIMVSYSDYIKMSLLNINSLANGWDVSNFVVFMDGLYIMSVSFFVDFVCTT